MRKVFLVLASVFALSAANAQTGKNQLGIGFEIGLPMGDFGDAFKTGFGGTAKYLHGVGDAAQVSLTSGFTTFKAKDGIDLKANIIPVLAGYRQNFSGFYVEPQLGVGFYSLKGGGESESKTAFTYAAGIGYAMSEGLDISARYQSGKAEDITFGLIGFRVAYNFSLGGASASK